MKTRSQRKQQADKQEGRTLTSGEGTNHDQSSAHTGKETLDTELTRHLDKSGSSRLSWCSLGLVDLGEQSVGGLRDNGSGHTGDQTTSKVDRHLLTTGKGVLGLAGELKDLFRGHLEAVIRCAPGCWGRRLTRRTWPWCKEPA
jgi:hypothetical protein